MTTITDDLYYAVEVTGDIEMAISMAPGLSSVLVYEGPTPLDEPPLGTNYVQDATTTAQINDVLNRMATDNLAKQLSCSYGMDINSFDRANLPAICRARPELFSGQRRLRGFSRGD